MYLIDEAVSLLFGFSSFHNWVFLQVATYIGLGALTMVILWEKVSNRKILLDNLSILKTIHFQLNQYHHHIQVGLTIAVTLYYIVVKKSPYTDLAVVSDDEKLYILYTLEIIGILFSASALSDSENSFVDF